MKIWQIKLNQVPSRLGLSLIKWWYLLALLVVLSLGQLQRFNIFHDISFYLHDLLIAGWLALNSLQLLSYIKAANYLAHLRIWWRELAFGGWLIFGMIFATPEIAPWLYLLRLVFYTLFLVSLRIAFQNKVVVLRVIIVLLGLLYVWYGILQYLFLPDTTFLFQFGWDDHYYRLIGTFLDPNFAGMIIVLVLTYLYSLKKLMSFPHFVITNLLLISALTVTYSRASYLAFFVLIGLFICSPKTKNFSSIKHRTLHDLFQRSGWGLAALLVMLLTYLLAPKPGGEGVNLSRTASIQARVKTSQLALANHTPRSFWVGKGFYSADLLQLETDPLHPTHARVPDNLFIFVFTSTGMVGLLLFMSLLMKYGIWLVRHDWLMFGALLATLIHSQFNNTLLEPFIFLFLGMGFSSLPKIKTKSIRL